MKKYEILCWNVNGIRAAERKGILDWLAETSPDMLCVQETKAHPEQLSKDLLNPDGYHVCFDSAEKKGYSGVATFSKIKPKRIQQGLGVEQFDSEGRTIITEFDDFTLINIYFPNGQKDKIRLQFKLDFYDATLDMAEKMRKSGHRLVICGDYNTAHKPIDLEHPKSNEKTSGFLPIEREWLDRLIERGYIDTLREFDQSPQLYSWWDMKSRARDRNVGWRIDYHFITADLRPHLKNAYILPDVMGSDHCPVGIQLEF